jgi:hypothetical protein
MPIKRECKFGEQTNKLWVWHSPKLQKGANIVMPNKLHVWVGTASAAEVGKMQYSCFFHLCSERSCHRFLLFPRIRVSDPLPQKMPLCLMLLLYIINALEVGGVLVCLHPSAQACLAQLYVCFVCCLLSFLHLPSPSVRFLGQACAGTRGGTWTGTWDRDDTRIGN